MFIRTLPAFAATALLAAFLSGSATSADLTDPRGVWIDATGQGAIEIADCGGKLCGRVVWLKSAAHADRCRLQVIDGVAPQADGNWGGGTIFDPEAKAKYNVELAPVDAGTLRVIGYVGSKKFSRTMTWTKAPAELQRCDDGRPPLQTAQADAAKAESAKPELAKPPAVVLVPVRPPAATTPPAAAPDTPAPLPAAEAPLRRQAAKSPPVRQATRADRPAKRRPETTRLASLGVYGLQDVTLTKARSACSLKISDFGRVAFPC